MRKILVVLAVFAAQAVYAQTPALKTDVEIDDAGKCRVRGPASTMNEVTPVLGAPVTVTSETQVLAKGVWIVTSSTDTVAVVISDGTAVTGVASGRATQCGS